MRLIVRPNRGFTLIEVVTIVVVLSILATFTASFIDNAVKTYMLAKKQSTLYQEASYIMERLERELRDMVNPASWTTGTTQDTVQFTRQHVTGQDSNTTITFWRDPGTKIFYRNSGGTSYIMGKNVTQFTIIRNATTTCNRYFSLTLALTESGQTFSLTSNIFPKNLGSGSYDDRCFNGDYEDVIQ